MKIEIRQQEFILLHYKAVYWPGKKTLLVGDLHLGKIGHFRKEGFALPAQAAHANFDRLDEIMSGYDITRILFLGDLFHSAYNAEWELFAAWRRQHAEVEMLIVLGNHDIIPRWLYWESNIRVFVDNYTEDGFLFMHHPEKSPDEAGRFVFSGHLHPVFVLSGKGRQALRLPCFMVSGSSMVLPGFGVFTGGYAINDLPYEEVYIVSGREVLKL